MIEHESFHLAMEGMPGYTKRIVFSLLHEKYANRLTFVGAKVSEDKRQIVAPTRPDLFSISSPPDPAFPISNHLNYAHFLAQEGEQVIKPARDRGESLLNFRSVRWAIDAYYGLLLAEDERELFNHLLAEVSRELPGIWPHQVFYLRVTEEQAVQDYRFWRSHQPVVKEVTDLEIKRLKKVRAGYELMALRAGEKCEILDGSLKAPVIVSHIQAWMKRQGVIV